MMRLIAALSLTLVACGVAESDPATTSTRSDALAAGPAACGSWGNPGGIRGGGPRNVTVTCQATHALTWFAAANAYLTAEAAAGGLDHDPTKGNPPGDYCATCQDAKGNEKQCEPVFPGAGGQGSVSCRVPIPCPQGAQVTVRCEPTNALLGWIPVLYACTNPCADGKCAADATDATVKPGDATIR